MTLVATHKLNCLIHEVKSHHDLLNQGNLRPQKMSNWHTTQLLQPHYYSLNSVFLVLYVSISLPLSLYIYIYIFKKKTKDRLIQDYKFISIPYFQFLVWTKNMKKKLIQDYIYNIIII